MIDIIILEPEHEENIGSIMRVMSNFEIKNLILVNPKCNPKSNTVKKVAKHSKIIPKVRKSIPKYKLLVGTTSKIFSDYNVLRSPLSPEQLRKKIITKTGILFGREGIGLTNKELQKCDFIVSIPTSKKYPALNLSHAISIILYELSKNRSICNSMELSENAEKKQITKMINSLINNANFSTKDKKTTQKKIWKNVFHKAILTKREAHGVMGLLNKLSSQKK